MTQFQGCLPLPPRGCLGGTVQSAASDGESPDFVPKTLLPLLVFMDVTPPPFGSHRRCGSLGADVAAVCTASVPLHVPPSNLLLKGFWRHTPWRTLVCAELRVCIKLLSQNQLRWVVYGTDPSIPSLRFCWNVGAYKIRTFPNLLKVIRVFLYLMAVYILVRVTRGMAAHVFF